jgi:hypothetical protein
MPGDVVLTRNAETTSSRGKIQASLIAKSTGGNFSHALLCTRPPTFIEAVGHGVSNISAQTCFAHDLKNVRLLRYHNPAIADEAGSEALPLLGKKYSVRMAVRSILPSVHESDVPEDELFCSALVAAAYRKAGAPEFATIDPMKVTPATLEKAAYFTDATADVFVRILSPSNIEYMSALDGDRVTSPLGGQAELFQGYCDVLLPMIQEFIDGTPELTITKRPTSFLECVFFIAAARRTCDELPDAIAADPRRKIAAIDDTAYDLLADGRYEEIQNIATAMDEGSLRYTIAQSFAADPDIDRKATRGLIVATRQQIASRSPMLQDPQLRGRARVTDKWIEITEEVVEVLNRRLLGLEEAFARVFPEEHIRGS